MLSSKLMKLCAGVLFLSAVTLASADPEQIKVYKEAFPDEKPKCIACHLDAIPKKDVGKHELNDYGKKVMELNAKPTPAEYQTVGKAGDFEPEQDKK